MEEAAERWYKPKVSCDFKNTVFKNHKSDTGELTERMITGTRYVQAQVR